MDNLVPSLAWTGALLVFGAIDMLVASGGFGRADLLLLGLGALPVAGFGWFVLGSRNPGDN